MNNRIKEIIKTNIKGQITGKQIAPVAIAGVPGIGKSAMVEQLAKENNYNILIVSVPTLSIELLTGLPTEFDNEDLSFCNTIKDTPTKETVWSIPELVANVNKLALEKDTILCLDDFHLIPSHLQAYFFKLLLNRMLGNYSLKSNIAIVLTLNDSTEAGFEQINSAVRNRMAIIPVKFDFEYWKENFGKSLNYIVLSFLNAYPKYIIEEESTGIEGYGSIRVWTHLANEIDLYNSNLTLEHLRIIVGAQVSKKATEAFIRHYSYVTKTNLESIVKNQQIIDLKTKKVIDSYLYAYILRFANTKKDGEFVLEFIEKNIDQEIFIGELAYELYNLSEDKNKPEAVDYIINELLNNSDKYSKLYDIMIKYLI